MAAASLSLPGVTSSPGWVRYIVQQHDNESQQFGRDTHRMAKKAQAKHVTRHIHRCRQGRGSDCRDGCGLINWRS